MIAFDWSRLECLHTVRLSKFVEENKPFYQKKIVFSPILSQDSLSNKRLLFKHIFMSPLQWNEVKQYVNHEL